MNIFKKLTLSLTAFMAVLVFGGSALAETPTPTSTPAYLTLDVYSQNNVINVGEVAYFTAYIKNTGGTTANSYLQAELPTDNVGGWTVLLSSFSDGCSIVPNSQNRPTLVCSGEVLGRANNSDGVTLVSFYGFTRTCGEITIKAEAYSSGTWQADTDVVRVLCPPTPTPTSAPTLTPTPTATNTPVVVVVTATPTNTSVVEITATPTFKAPLPPNTGTGIDKSNNSAFILFASLGIAALAFGLIGATVTRRK